MVSWIITWRGASMTTLPRASNRHGVIRCASLVFPNAVRASAADWSRPSGSAALVSSRFCPIFEPSAGATSSSSCAICMVIHEGIVATMFARYPKIIDFSCGFQSYLPSGTCSRARRERSTSRSISASRYSVSFILASSSKRASQTDRTRARPQGSRRPRARHQRRVLGMLPEIGLHERTGRNDREPLAARVLQGRQDQPVTQSPAAKRIGNLSVDEVESLPRQPVSQEGNLLSDSDLDPVFRRVVLNVHDHGGPQPTAPARAAEINPLHSADRVRRALGRPAAPGPWKGLN